MRTRYVVSVSVDGLVELSIHVTVEVCHRPGDINISISSATLPHNLALAMTGSALYTRWLVVVHLAGMREFREDSECSTGLT